MPGIPKGLLIAGGIGALAIGGFMFLKRGGDKEGADPASKDVTKAPGDPGATPTAGTPAGGALPGAAGEAAAGQAALPGGQAGGAQGEQVGPYTLLDDPQGSGMKMVIETATQQPVGLLDPQGKFTPVGVDAAGNIVPGAQAGSATSSTMPTGTGAVTSTGTTTTSPTGLSAPTGQATAGSQYAQIAEALFAGAGDPTVGSASSDVMSGTAALTPTGTTTGYASAATTALAPSPTSVASPSTGGVQGQQVGPYTIIPDPASGQQVVFDTATRQPVGVLDQAGQLVPINGAAVSGPASPSTLGSAMPAPVGAAY